MIPILVSARWRPPVVVHENVGFGAGLEECATRLFRFDVANDGLDLDGRGAADRVGGFGERLRGPPVDRYCDAFLGKRIESRQTRDIVQIWRLEDNRFRVHAEFMGHILSIQRNCEQNKCTHSITSFGLIDNF